MRYANFSVVDDRGGRLVIRDVGPHDRYLTVTNAAESVVETLVREGRLKPDTRLYYCDSDGEPGELLHDGARFTGFGPWDGKS